MAIATLRAKYALPIVGVEPAVKPAVEATRSGVIGVLATSGTLESPKFSGLLGRFGGGARVIVQPCAGLVEQVESGDLSGPATRELLERYVRPLLAQGADTLVLGCTHYPLLSHLIREVAGPGVAIIETGAAVSRQLARVLTEQDLLAHGGRSGTTDFWTSGDPAHLDRVIGRLWPQGGAIRPLPDPIR
jgi:glutamate racemase